MFNFINFTQSMKQKIQLIVLDKIRCNKIYRNIRVYLFLLLPNKITKLVEYTVTFYLIIFYYQQQRELESLMQAQQNQLQHNLTNSSSDPYSPPSQHRALLLDSSADDDTLQEQPTDSAAVAMAPLALQEVINSVSLCFIKELVAYL